MHHPNLSSFKTSTTNSLLYLAQMSEVHFKLAWLPETTSCPPIKEIGVLWVPWDQILDPNLGLILGTKTVLKHLLLCLWMILKLFHLLAHLVGNGDQSITAIDLGMDILLWRKRYRPLWPMWSECRPRLLLGNNEGTKLVEE